MAGTIYASIEEAVKDILGAEKEIKKTERIHGGDINDAYRLTFSGGERIFVKTNSKDHMDFFTAESAGLNAIRETEQIGVPEVLGMGKDEKRGISFLLLEYIESGPLRKSYWERFGRELAGMHRAECGRFVGADAKQEIYGFYQDNFIGAAPQKNHPKSSWIEFYRECRLVPQLSRACRYLTLEEKKKADFILEHLDYFLREPKVPSLLHGDLWSGNMMCGAGGKPWVIDPAVYAGDFEADLAMMQMFGSPSQIFYDAYNEINPIDWKGYSRRKDLYDFYHLLNHLNLFGTAYLGSVVATINRLYSPKK